MGNPLVEELKYECIQAMELAQNSFAKRDEGVNVAGEGGDVFGTSNRSGISEINKLASMDGGPPVVMDGRNTETPGGQVVLLV